MKIHESEETYLFYRIVGAAIYCIYHTEVHVDVQKPLLHNEYKTHPFLELNVDRRMVHLLYASC